MNVSLICFDNYNFCLSLSPPPPSHSPAIAQLHAGYKNKYSIRQIHWLSSNSDLCALYLLHNARCAIVTLANSRHDNLENWAPLLSQFLYLPRRTRFTQSSSISWQHSSTAPIKHANTNTYANAHTHQQTVRFSPAAGFHQYICVYV